jgi:uncharacterized protein GlcG (DUF336 family)
MLMKRITLETAKKVLEASKRWARDIAGQPCSVAILDKAGAVIAVHRMDGAAMFTTDIAIEKAWTAIAFRHSISGLSKALDPTVGVQSGYHGLALLAKDKGRFTLIAGGLPISGDNSEIIGAIGCSGVDDAEGEISDTKVCEVGLAALNG